jgi:hypothetical protein
LKKETKQKVEPVKALVEKKSESKSKELIQAKSDI